MYVCVLQPYAQPQAAYGGYPGYGAAAAADPYAGQAAAAGGYGGGYGGGAAAAGGGGGASQWQASPLTSFVLAFLHCKVQMSLEAALLLLLLLLLLGAVVKQARMAGKGTRLLTTALKQDVCHVCGKLAILQCLQSALRAVS